MKYCKDGYGFVDSNDYVIFVVQCFWESFKVIMISLILGENLNGFAMLTFAISVVRNTAQ